MSQTPADQSDHLQALPAVLPSLLRGASVSRAQIIVDQLKTAIHAGRQDLVHLLGTSAADPLLAVDAEFTSVDSQTTAAAVVLIRQPPSDAATLLAGGFLPHAADTLPTDPALRARLATRLSGKVDRMMRDHAINFLQWATDPVQADAPVAAPENHESRVQSLSSQDAQQTEPDAVSPAEFGFENAATLQYLSGDLAGDSAAAPCHSKPIAAAKNPAPEALQVTEVDGDDGDDVSEFSDLVGATYVGSLDCPRLSSYRTASEIVASYRTTPSYRPGWWLSLSLTDAPAVPIGCLIMACHGDNHAGTADETETDRSDTPAAVAELVYMGLLPEFRGRGLGRRIVATAQQTARAAGCQRMILAVDVNNGPAVDAYQAFGMTPVMKETVWVKAVSQSANPPPPSS